MRAYLPAFARHLGDRRSPRTRKTYEAILASFAAFLERERPDGAPAARTDIEAFLARPRGDGTRRSPAGRNQELAALRAFAAFAMRDLGWTLNPTEGIPFAREAPRDPAVLSVFEVRRLFTLAAEEKIPWARARNLALLAVLAQAGLRVHELVALDVDQTDLVSATLVGVHGKGGTLADVPLNGATVSLLAAWLGERTTIADENESALFVSSRGTRLSVRAVQRLMQDLRLAMGSKKRITPHTMRHTTATLALTLGADLSTVGDLLRHADLNTTRRYLHLVDERRREAVRRLEVAIPPELAALVRAPAPAATSTPAPSRDVTSLRPANVRPAAQEEVDAQHGLGDAA
jgi:integrase/recombinase XerC